MDGSLWNFVRLFFRLCWWTSILNRCWIQQICWIQDRNICNFRKNSEIWNFPECRDFINLRKFMYKYNHLCINIISMSQYHSNPKVRNCPNSLPENFSGINFSGTARWAFLKLCKTIADTFIMLLRKASSQMSAIFPVTFRTTIVIVNYFN